MANRLKPNDRMAYAKSLNGKSGRKHSIPHRDFVHNENVNKNSIKGRTGYSLVSKIKPAIETLNFGIQQIFASSLTFDSDTGGGLSVHAAGWITGCSWLHLHFQPAAF